MPDSGLMGDRVGVVICQIDSLAFQEGHEGIEDVVILTESQLRDQIKTGRIDDSYTLAAWGSLCAMDIPNDQAVPNDSPASCT